jgi:hypothetical protein
MQLDAYLISGPVPLLPRSSTAAADTAHVGTIAVGHVTVAVVGAVEVIHGAVAVCAEAAVVAVAVAGVPVRVKAVIVRPVLEQHAHGAHVADAANAVPPGRGGRHGCPAESNDEANVMCDQARIWSKLTSSLSPPRVTLMPPR